MKKGPLFCLLFFLLLFPFFSRSMRRCRSRNRAEDLVAFFVKKLYVKQEKLRRAHFSAGKKVRALRLAWNKDREDPVKKALYQQAVAESRNAEWDYFSVKRTPVYTKLETEEENLRQLLSTCFTRQGRTLLKKIIRDFKASMEGLRSSFEQAEIGGFENPFRWADVKRFFKKMYSSPLCTFMKSVILKCATHPNKSVAKYKCRFLLRQFPMVREFLFMCKFDNRILDDSVDELSEEKYQIF